MVKGRVGEQKPELFGTSQGLGKSYKHAVRTHQKRRYASMKAKTVAADLQSREHDVAKSGRTQAPLASTPSLEEIRQRAHELHLEGGCMHGRDLDDWLQAEREIKEKQQAG
jgi:hypothetical protein